MPSKLAFPIAIALTAFSLMAPSALALGIQHQRTAERSDLPVQSSSSLIAPATACPNQANASASPEAQQPSMRCMTDFARSHSGLGNLGDLAELDRSARAKSDDILRCDSFSHEACGRSFTYWMQRVGYIPARCWRAGENIAWGTGSLGSVRSIFRSWIHSPEHRENILGSYSQIGVGLEIGRLQGRDDVHVWTQHFGSHCGDPVRTARPRLARLALARRAR
jgi:uncharacterized protein YkwD